MKLPSPYKRGFLPIQKDPTLKNAVERELTAVGNAFDEATTVINILLEHFGNKLSAAELKALNDALANVGKGKKTGQAAPVSTNP